jgi:hypothetical protein
MKNTSVTGRAGGVPDIHTAFQDNCASLSRKWFPLFYPDGYIDDTVLVRG